MAPLSKGARSRCPYCGRLSRLPTPEGKPCRECERIAREAGCTPRAWDAEFDSRLAWLFITHPGEWIRPTELMPCCSEDAKWGVRLLRRRGFQIEGDAARGYRLTGWARWPCESESAPAPHTTTEGG